MRVVFIDRYGANSIWSVLHPVAKQLVADGNEAIFVKVDDGNQRATIESPQGVNTHIIKLNIRKSGVSLFIKHFFLLFKFYFFLKKNHVDIVHGNFIFPSWIARLVSKLFGVIYVNTRHEVFESMSWHWQLLDKLSMTLVDANIFISDVVAKSYKSRFVFDKHACTIKNGIDIETLDRIKRVKPDNAQSMVVICPGRFVPVKGQIFLIEAWPAVLKRFPEARLCLPGAGPDEQKLKQRCQELGIENHVDFPGWLPREEILVRIGNAQIMAVPSAQEGFGLVVAEAMALGVPLICSDIPVFREVAGDTAGYFPVGEVQCLADDIIRILEQPEQARCKAEAGRERVCRLFDQRKMVAAYLALYDQLLERKR